MPIPFATWQEALITSILESEETELRNIEQHRASKWQNWNSYQLCGELPN
jgi:hypothetical protein